MPSPTRVQGTTGTATGTTTAVTITVSAGSLLTDIVQGGSATDTPLSTSDNNGNTWNNAPDVISDATIGNAIGGCYAMNSNAGSTTITGNASSNNTGHTIRIIVDEFSNVATTSALRDHGGRDNTSASVTSTNATTSGSAAQVGDLGLSACNNGSNQTFSAGSWTGSPTVNLSDVIPAAGSSRNALQWCVINTAGSQTSTMNGSATNTGWIEVILIFAQAAAYDPTAQRNGDEYGVTDAGGLLQFLNVGGF